MLSEVVFSSADVLKKMVNNRYRLNNYEEEVVEESEERSLVEVFSVELVVLSESQAHALKDLLEDIILVGVDHSLEEQNDKLRESVNVGEVHSRVEVRFVIGIQSVGR